MMTGSLLPITLALKSSSSWTVKMSRRADVVERDLEEELFIPKNKKRSHTVESLLNPRGCVRQKNLGSVLYSIDFDHQGCDRGRFSITGRPEELSRVGSE